MHTIGKIFVGIWLGMILSFIIGMVLFQGYLFDRGTEVLGIGTVGLTYFLGGFIASLILMFSPGARDRKQLIWAYPVTAVVVGSLALTGLMSDIAVQHQGGLFAVEQMLSEVSRMVGLMFFWGTPTVVTGGYAYMYWSAAQDQLSVTDIK